MTLRMGLCLGFCLHPVSLFCRSLSENHEFFGGYFHLLVFILSVILLLVISVILFFSRLKYKENEKRFYSLFEFSPVSLWEEDFSELKIFLEKNIEHKPGSFKQWIEEKPERLEQCIRKIHIRSVNKKTVELYKARDKEHVISHYELLFPALRETGFIEEIETFWNGADRFSSDFQEMNLAGEAFHTHVNISIVPGYEKNWKKVFVSVEDVSDRISYEQRLLASLDEKKVLLREIHHRVKNNLAIVSSFLYLQLGDFEDEKMISVLQKSQARIQAMALIHEKLYQNESIMNINLPEYTENLAYYLIRSYNNEEKNVHYIQDVENLPLIIDQLIPLGLILTEVISNSMKYAFANESRPVISLQMVRREGKQIRTVISDNGHGIRADQARPHSIGMDLMHSLAEQLEGSLKIQEKEGTEITLDFLLHC